MVSFTAGSYIPNILNAYKSFNCIFTLSALSPDETNFPENTYRNGNPRVNILRSGGGLGDNKATTALEKFGKLELFIDDVEIDSLMTPGSATGVTNATSIEFKVHEPYSMGLFINVLKEAAYEAGFVNYLEAPYMLKVEFVGYADDETPYTPNRTTRYFPMRMVDIQFTVDAGGAIYTVKAIPWNEQSLSDQVTTITTDANITGRTLREILQTGERSLAAVVNYRLDLWARQNGIRTPDQIAIMFPENVFSDVNSGQLRAISESATLSVDRYTRNQIMEARDQIGPEARLFANAFNISSSRLGSLNESAFRSNNSIGDAQISRSILQGGLQPMGIDAAVIDTERDISFYRRENLRISDDLRDFQIFQNSTITSIIEQLVLVSEYAKNSAERGADGNGKYNWFRIETETYVNPDVSSVQTTGYIPKIHVYKVLPYDVHADIWMPPTSALPNASQLADQAVKEYNYIYTANNKDVLNFDLKFNLAFFQAITDVNSGADTKTTTSGTMGQDSSQTLPFVLGSGLGVLNSEGTSVFRESTGSTEMGMGIGRNQISERMSRQLHRAILDGVDLIELDLTIMGDPYYIADSGMGNYTSRPLFPNINEDGTMNYQEKEVDVIVNFRTPVDYRLDNSGEMLFPEQLIQVRPFSGIYRVIEVKNSFQSNRFTQVLKLQRRLGQDAEGPAINRMTPGAPSIRENEPRSLGNLLQVAEATIDRFTEVISRLPLPFNFDGNFIETARNFVSEITNPFSTIADFANDFRGSVSSLLSGARGGSSSTGTPSSPRASGTATGSRPQQTQPTRSFGTFNANGTISGPGQAARGGARPRVETRAERIDRLSGGSGASSGGTLT